MKKPTSLVKLLVLLLTLVAAGPVLAQTDTLHLYYVQASTKMPDSTEAKLTAWAKKLAGQHVDVKIYAYYHKAEFKKFAQERSDDMFLMINRKARDLITLRVNEPKKGENSQRSTVDVIYSPTGAPPVAKSPAAKKDDQKKEAAPANTKTDGEKKEKKVAEPKDKSQDKKKEKDAVAKKDDKKEEGKSKEDDKEGDDKKPERPGLMRVGTGNLVKDEEVKQIKESKLIVAKLGYPETDEAMLSAAKNFWNFTSDVTSMPYEEAVTFAKANPNTVILTLGRVKSVSLTHNGSLAGLANGVTGAYQTISSGVALVIVDAKEKTLAISFIPTFADHMIAPEVLAFGVSNLNYMLKTMDEKKMASNMKLKSAYKEHSEQLKLKTLYIPQIWLSEKVTPAEISELYKAKVEVVSYDDWKNAILSKKSDVAYAIVSPMPIGGEFVYVHYLMDAETGMVYAFCVPQAASVSGINVSKANTGRITEKNIKKYNDAIAGDW